MHDLIERGATEEQLIKFALLDVDVYYSGTGAHWYWDKELKAPWCCMSSIYAGELWQGEDPSWNVTFFTLGDLLDAVIYLRSGQRGNFKR